jgi:hypothetical protein
MAFSDKLTVVIDFVTGPAQSGLGKMRGEVAKAEGAFGKMKAAGSVAFDSVKANAANFAIAAGSALVAFGVKSVQAFQDTALAAGQFSDATGLAVDDASRWIEVAGDFGIEAGAVQGAMLKMNKAIGDGKPVMDEFGDSIVRAKDGTVDSAATFQNLVTKIGAIKDPTDRAKAAQEAFGKSYGDVSRFMEMSAGELAAALGNVSEQKVIDKAELEKAREFQASMDGLKDKLEDVMMTVGEGIVPALSDLAENVSYVTDKFTAVSGVIEDVTGSGLFEWADQIINPLNVIGDAWDGLFGDDEVVAATVSIEEGTAAAAAMAAMYAERLVPTVEDSTHVFDAAAEQANNLAIKTGRVELAAQALSDEWDRLKGKIDDKAAWFNMQATFDDIRDKGAAAMQAVADGTEDAEQKMNEYNNAVIGGQQEVFDLGKQLGLLPDEVSVLIDLAENGQIDELERRLTILTRNRTANLNIIERGGAGYGDRFGGPKANGGPVTAGTPYLVGERGPEIVVPGRSGTVIPNNRIGGGGGMGGSISVAIYPKTLPTDRELIDLVTNLRRRNGNVI